MRIFLNSLNIFIFSSTTKGLSEVVVGRPTEYTGEDDDECMGLKEVDFHCFRVFVCSSLV